MIFKSTLHLIPENYQTSSVQSESRGTTSGYFLGHECGATENAGMKNARRSKSDRKTRDCKKRETETQDWKIQECLLWESEMQEAYVGECMQSISLFSSLGVFFCRWKTFQGH